MLTVFEERQQAGTGTGVFTGGQPRVRGAANSLRIGDKLHLALVVAEIPENLQALNPGLNYSYNVGLAPFDEGAAQAAILDPATLTPTADLKSEKLLRNEPINGKPHKALGYDVGELPGFALPPPALTDLRLLHGSCRRPSYAYPDDPEGTKSFDGLAWVDDLILEWRRGTDHDARVRPEHSPAPALLHRRPDLRGRRLSGDAPDAQQGGQRADRSARAPADAVPAEGRRREP